MKINNISFITPLTGKNKIILDKNYSRTLILSNESTINLSSNIGPKLNQEDCIAVSQNNEYLLLLVADGIGGLTKGEEASYKIANIIKRWFESQTEEYFHNLDELTLEETITEIIDIARKIIIPDNSGTTLNMSIIGPENTFIVNIGDSRTYSIKDKKITLRTRDDSLAFRRLNPTKAENRDMLRFYKANNVVTNTIVKDFLPVVAVSTINNKEYDILCHVTDGVSDILTENQIRDYSLSNNPATILVQESISSAPIQNNNQNNTNDFYKYIEPHDNSSAIVYTKTKKKNP